MVKFEYNDENHLYRLDGQVIPSVTQVLSLVGITDYSHIPSDKRESSMRFGTAVHLATSLWDKNDLDETTLSPMIIPYLDGWKKFLSDTKARIVQNEEPSYSPKYRYGFKIDRILEIHKRLTVVDIKTSADPQQGTDLQLAAYYAGWNEGRKRNEQALDRIAIHLTNEGKYKIEPYKNKNDVNEWLTCLFMYNTLKRRGRV